MPELREALKSLGYKSGHVKVYGRVDLRVFVIVNDRFVGVYDIERKTFVD